MIRAGEVIESENGRVTVVFERPAACENCKGCLEKNCVQLELAGEANVGDQVQVELPDRSVVKASALMYLVPLAGLLIGLFLGQALHDFLQLSMNRDVFAALFGGILLSVGLLGVHAVDKKLRARQDWQPHIVRIDTQQP
ncbi:MAG: SoxR reducing system RseC family protein [Oscillospiraceae bacterium]|jgi:sigma-E factor negative regulatory protein RseC|nr:SoxR reducing system RseC family protein [Oscillospiraceae bacterium]